jgi:putative alpha-1,2-mannosidase
LGGEKRMMKVAISYVSVEEARNNLNIELKTENNNVDT